MSKAAMKAKALTLNPHEARRLRDTGRVLIVRKVDEMPTHRDGDEWWISTGRNTWTSTLRQEVCVRKSTREEISRREYHISKDELLMETCPFGPVGSELWGREGWAKAPRGVIYRVDHDRGDGWGSGVIDLETGEMMPLAWMSPTSMSRERSRFPHLVLAAREVKRAGDATQDEIAAMGLADGPLDIPADRWCWFATIEDAKREGVAS